MRTDDEQRKRDEELRSAVYWFSHRPEWYWRVCGRFIDWWRRHVVAPSLP